MAQYEEFAPSPRLAPYIECYWARMDTEGTTPHPVPPDGCVDMLFSSRNGEPVSLDLVGLMTATQAFHVPPGQFYFGARFRPGMASAWIPETALLNDKTEPLQNLMPGPARELFQKLADAPTPLRMTQVLDAFLRPFDKPVQHSEKVLRRLALVPASLDTLAKETNISTRQLRRVCLERTGVSPKYLLRILRFREAAGQIAAIASRKAQVSWADFAIACGYYDQAHFIREFQHFRGETPGRYLQSLASPTLQNGFDEPKTGKTNRLR